MRLANRKARRFSSALFLFCCLGLSQTAPLYSADEGLSEEVLKKVKSATVFLRVLKPTSASQGSAFFLTPAVLVTNAHVIGMDTQGNPKPRRIQGVLFSGDPKREKTYTLRVLAADPDTDLAFLCLAEGEKRFENQPDPLPLASANNVRETLPVYIAGFPFGDVLAGKRENPAVTVSKASVSSLRLDKSDKLELIQISGNLNPGNSGGPIVNAAGEVVAVSVSTILGTTVSFAIPCDVVREKQRPRVLDQRITGASKQDGKYSFEIALSLYNPLDGVREVEFEYLVGANSSPYSAKMQDLQDKASPDGKQAPDRISLKHDKDTDEWRGTANGIDLPDDKALWVRALILAGNQKIPMAPLNIAARVRSAERGHRDTSEKSQKKIDSISPSLPLPVPPKDDDTSKRTVAMPQFISFGENLIQLAGTPDSQSIYATFKDDPNIAVVGTDDLKPYSKILAARFPQSMWCDGDELIVHCGESRALQIFDRKTQKATRAIRLNESWCWYVRGRTPNGGYLALTGSAGRDLLGRPHILEKDGSEKFSLNPGRPIHSIAMNNSSTFVYSWKDSFGICRDDGFKILGELSYAHGLLPNIDRSTGKVEYGECYSIPKSSVVLLDWTHFGLGQYVAGGTFAIAPSLRRTLFKMQGKVIAVVPARGYCVLLDLDFQGAEFTNPSPKDLVVHFASLSNGRVFRKVFVRMDDKAVKTLYGRNQQSPSNLRALYLERSGIVLITGTNPESSLIAKVDCGKIVAELPDDPYFYVKNDPAKSAKQGEEFSLAPDIVRLGATEGFSFKLKQGPIEMRIDRKTGAITWTPSAAYRGFYDVEIVATRGNIEIPVLYWILEIQP